MATVSVRYIVNDVDEAIRFYCQHLGFEEVMHPAPTFAMLSRGDLRLVLERAGGARWWRAGDARRDVPTPGGWNRFSIEVRGPRRRGHDAARARGALPERHRGRRRRPADPRRGPVGQPRRALPADAAGGLALRIAADRAARAGARGVEPLCQQRGAEHFGDLMTSADGRERQVMDRDGARLHAGSRRGGSRPSHDGARLRSRRSDATRVRGRHDQRHATHAGRGGRAHTQTPVPAD